MQTESSVWYVAYGSNLRWSRFRCYLAGGRPSGAARAYPGCRDPREPVSSAPTTLAGDLLFTGESGVWSGGVALHDPQGRRGVAGRAYLVTWGQLSDVVAQETRQAPGHDLRPGPDGRVPGASGWYDTLREVGERAGRPMFTLGASRVGRESSPSEVYLRVFLGGLVETFGWDAARAVGYLLGIRGARPAWTFERLMLLARDGS